jgi:type VI secretion system secreted protein Hcp
MKKLVHFGFSAAVFGLTVMAMPAETVHLFLKANGANIQGDSTVTSLGRENTIQCLAFENKVATAREASSGLATGRRTYEPIVIRKRIDKSSPLLAKALAQNEVIEGVFRFYRPNPAGDGTTQHFFTVEIKGGRVASYRPYVPDTFVPATATQPPLEEVAFVFQTIRYRYEPNGIEFQDTAMGIRGSAQPIAPTRIVPPPHFLNLIPGYENVL